MQASRQVNHHSAVVAPSALPLLPQLRADKENVAANEKDMRWGFDSELIDPELKDMVAHPGPSVLAPTTRSDLLASDYASTSTFSPAIHSTPKKHLSPLALVPIPPSPVIGPLPQPTTTQNFITSVPLQGEHPIHHLRKVLYEFNSTFGGEGIICAIETLLSLPPPALTIKFYHGEYATPDGKCPFCAKGLK